ncbi:MAG: hypothetical protein HYV02_03515 [Deltaproteobacteria bacterium]|nr:hypothetical protein [Deltaproteobacteria bacterium]
MRYSSLKMRHALLVHCVAMLMFCGYVSVVRAETYVVNEMDDLSAPCTADSCSLRAAITAANANPGADVIHFFIIPGMLMNIEVTSPLPVITDSVSIDGFSLPESQPNTDPTGNNALILVTIDGTLAGPTDALVLNANACDIRGLRIIHFDGSGIKILGNHNAISGNVLGGSKGKGQSFAGISISGGQSNAIGDASLDARNVISDNSYGVYIGNAATLNTVAGNLIGTSENGKEVIGTGFDGVTIYQATNNTVGGSTSLSANVIVGAQYRNVLIVDTASTRNKVIGNYIGTDISGSLSFPSTITGVFISDGAKINTIGGSGVGNIIRHHKTGITLLDGVRNHISLNSISMHEGLGIDLGGDGVTPNDADDSDGGPNQQQNFPEITEAKTVSGTTIITGVLYGSPGKYDIEVYSNAVCNASSHGEGEIWIGTQAGVEIGADGETIFEMTIPSDETGFVTATATDALRNTSEFSACRNISHAGTVQFAQASYVVSENAGEVLIDIARLNGSDGEAGATVMTVADGTAADGVDFAGVVTMVSFADGDATMQPVAIPILDNAELDGARTFSVALSDVTGDATLEEPTSVLVTIVDDEQCGNGVVDVDEECDDGNVTAGDGCDAQCFVESEEPTEDVGGGADISEDNAESGGASADVPDDSSTPAEENASDDIAADDAKTEASDDAEIEASDDPGDDATDADDGAPASSGGGCTLLLR